jgi:N-dimethylarginine dimethylaminohydrolase
MDAVMDGGVHDEAGAGPLRLLMCPPTHFGVRYEINPWMSVRRRADPERATRQWERLRDTFVALGAQVDLETPAPGLPDQVFSANAGFVLGDRAVSATFVHPERQGEESIHERWFAEEGFATVRCDAPLEGAGDLCGAGGVLLGGYGIRSDLRALPQAAAWLGVDVMPVEMVDPWLYHLDLVVAPLGGGAALVAPHGLSTAGARTVRDAFADVIELTPEETGLFVANCMVVGGHVVMHRCPPRIRRELAARGLEAVECPVDEFLKAGGAVRCLALRLDGGPGTPAPRMLADAAPAAAPLA